jgi:hypothetical protein
VSTRPDLYCMARDALSASTTTEGEVAVWYLACSRIAFTQATEELKALERLLIARERELARVGRPKQLATTGSEK